MDSSAPWVTPLDASDADALLEVDQWAFAIDTDGLDPSPALACLEWDRTFGAYLDEQDGKALAGVTSTYSFDLPIPGGSMPAAGLTWVGVHPQFRRRGVMTALLRHHLRTVHEQGETVSVLHASEPIIYGRFGYGVASRHLRMTIPSGSALRELPGAEGVRIRVRKVDVDRDADVVGDCFEAARRSRPGMVSRNTPAHRRAILDDQPKRRDGFESLRIIVAEADDAGPARGYALFRRKDTWTAAGPAGHVHVRELVARDPAAARALWQSLLGLDLMRTVEADDRPTDDELLTLLHDARSFKPVVGDGLWLRLVDVGAALGRRRYSHDVDAVLDVTDDVCLWNAGRWRLVASADGARCERTDRPADVRLDVRELGSLYLGSTSLLAVRSAGLAQAADDDAALHVATAFSWPVAAYCGRVF